jgi:hypothetical protein
MRVLAGVGRRQRGLAATIFASLLLGLTLPARAQSLAPEPDSAKLYARAHIDWLFPNSGSNAGTGVAVGASALLPAKRFLLLGAMVSTTVGTLNTESNCYYNNRCFYAFTRLGVVAEAHAAPSLAVDPWLSLGLGFEAIGSDNKHLSFRKFGVDLCTEAGIDFHLWRISAAPYVIGQFFSGGNGPVSGFGGRVGYTF